MTELYEVAAKSAIPDDEAFKAEALERGFSQCANALIRTLYATPIGWALVFSLVYGVVPTSNFLSWIAAFFICWLLCLQVVRKICNEGPKLSTHRLQLAVVVILDGVCWGAMVFALMSYDHRLDAWLVIVLCGVISVNLPTYITYPSAFRLLAIAMWLGITFSVLALGHRFDKAPQLIFSILVYFALLVFTIQPISVRVIDGIRLMLENTMLAEQLKQSFEYVSHQANTDALTGKMNRHALNQALSDMIVRGERRSDVFSLLMIDVDFFKKINDVHGHDVGDVALKCVAQRISGELRSADLCARYGGEEFVVLLPMTNSSTAFDVAERIRRALAATPLETVPALPVTLSIGVATYQPGMTAEMILKAADIEVYAAKKNGRNQVQVYQPS